MHERDLQRRGLASGDLARVKTHRGEILVRVEASDAMRSGQAFMPMHWGSQFMRGAGVNVLTNPAIDPFSKQPELKHAAVQVSRAELPYRVVAMRRFAAGESDAARQLTRDLRRLLEKFDYATLVPSGREQVVVSLRGYAAAALAAEILDRLDALLLLDRPEQTMRYVDARKGVEKAARIVDGPRGKRLFVGRNRGAGLAQEHDARRRLGRSLPAVDTRAGLEAAAGKLEPRPHRVRLRGCVGKRNRRCVARRRGFRAAAVAPQMRHRMRLVCSGTQALVRGVARTPQGAHLTRVFPATVRTSVRRSGLTCRIARSPPRCSEEARPVIGPAYPETYSA